MQSDADIRTLALLLDWYQAIGLDTVVAEEATNWLEHGDVPPGRDFRLPSTELPTATVQPTPGQRQFDPAREARPAPAQEPRRTAPTAPPRAAPTQPPAAPPRQFTSTAPDAAELGARTAARTAKSLEELEAALKNFDGCGLKATAKNLCFYRGAPKARVMIIGEAPGRDEDMAGKPFIGRAGQLLDKMLAAIGLNESNVHITNIVYWRPPGNRTPTAQEGQVCRPFLERQLELVEPDIVLLFGGAAAKHVLDTPDGIMRIRGKWREMQIGSRTVKVMATLHPAYLLRTPAAKRQAWRDLLAVRAQLGS
jgi:uracil-DNA glycosylase family 4